MIWIDAQLSPSVAAWITADLGLDAKALRELAFEMRRTKLSILRLARQTSL